MAVGTQQRHEGNKQSFHGTSPPIEPEWESGAPCNCQISNSLVAFLISRKAGINQPSYWPGGNQICSLFCRRPESDLGPPLTASGLYLQRTRRCVEARQKPVVLNGVPADSDCGVFLAPQYSTRPSCCMRLDAYCIQSKWSRNQEHAKCRIRNARTVVEGDLLLDLIPSDCQYILLGSYPIQDKEESSRLIAVGSIKNESNIWPTIILLF